MSSLKIEVKSGQTTVTMADGLRISFYRNRGKVSFVVLDGTGFYGKVFYDNEVEETSIQKTDGGYLDFYYYTEFGTKEHIRTKTTIAEVDYEDDYNDDDYNDDDYNDDDYDDDDYDDDDYDDDYDDYDYDDDDIGDWWSFR